MLETNRHLVFPSSVDAAVPVFLFLGSLLTIATMRKRSTTATGSKLTGNLLTAMPCTVYALLIPYWGTPSGAVSTVVLVTLGGLSWWMAKGRRRRQISGLVMWVVAGIWLFGSARGCMDVDLRNGLVRYGIPGFAKFARATNGTEIIHRYIGKGPCCWTNFILYDWKIVGLPLNRVRDFSTSVDSASPALDAALLQELLARLPSDADRVHVLRLMTDCRNFGRWRQDTLLVTMMLVPREDSEAYAQLWDEHRRFFVRDPDTSHAKRISWTWIPLLRAYARQYAETPQGPEIATQLRRLEEFARFSMPDDVAVDLRFNAGRGMHSASQCAKCHVLPESG